MEFKGKKIEVRELTYREVEQVLEDLQSNSPHPVEAECPGEPVSALALSLSTGIPVDELLDLRPSQVRALVPKVREANPSMARTVDDLSVLAARLMQAEETGEISPEPSTLSEEQPAG